jgi:hypothetical protein
VPGPCRPTTQLPSWRHLGSCNPRPAMGQAEVTDRPIVPREGWGSFLPQDESLQRGSRVPTPLFSFSEQMRELSPSGTRRRGRGVWFKPGKRSHSSTGPASCHSHQTDIRAPGTWNVEGEAPAGTSKNWDRGFALRGTQTWGRGFSLRGAKNWNRGLSPRGTRLRPPGSPVQTWRSGPAGKSPPGETWG